MRKLGTTILIAVFALVTFGQDLPIDASTNLVTYTKIVDSKNMSAQELFDLGKKFCIQKGYVLKEETAGQKFEYNAAFPIFYPGVSSPNDEGKVKFSFYMDFKDNKYRYILSEFTHTGKVRNSDGGAFENKSAACGGQKMTGRGWVTIKNKTNSKILDMMDELEQMILEVENDPKKNSDW